ncbi:MAG: hypothetical protein A2V60_03135 [Candidatus Portnoybacteria bacterium RIFCSPHIGHO2_01_FULL_39_19]|nr:MAG: hypothetical protein A2V60_03135 [Candidatus Portnoybacteria bacterium RIFCSPHIGHO2_01_FULL_39_19]
MKKKRKYIAKLRNKKANPFDPNADPFESDYFERIGVRFTVVRAQNKKTARGIIKKRTGKSWILVKIIAG